MAVQLAIAQQPGDVKIEEKSFTTRAGDVYEYDLGTIYVPENRDDPDSRVIGVGFARFRSTASSPPAPAMFILPGGPGGSYLARMKSSSSNRERMAEELTSFLPICDVVYVDQRGFSEHGDVLVGQMSAPKRPTDRAITEEDWVAAFETFARETVTKFAETNVDLSGYTVKECANDNCLWLFLDRTRNHGKRWCEMKGCGNRAKVRGHRARQRKAARRS